MRFGLLIFAPLAFTAYLISAEYPTYELEDINFSDLVVLDSSCAVRLAQVLTRDGALQIKNIPNFSTAKQEAFNGLPECLSSEPNSATMSMSDRSIRRTTAAETQSGVIGKMNTKCGESASKLRAAVDITIGQLVAALDRAVHERSMSSSGSSIPVDQQYVMKPYKSFKSLVANGSHLEHLHVYSPPASGQSKMSSSDAKTMDFHTDSGFLVAMTRGYYSSSTESVYSDRDIGRGLYLELSTGQRVKVDASDDALVVMVGAAASTWLEPLLGKPLRPAPHALVAGLSDAHPSVTRSWFGKMYLPPKDAVLPNPERASKQGRERQLTYGQYREWELSGSTSQSSLPAACEIRTSSIPAATSSSSYSLLSSSNSLCTLSSGGTGVQCWMQCLAVDSLPCGTNAVCVDTVTGQEVDGSDHCPESDKTLCTLQCPAGATNSTSTFDGFCYGSGVSMYMAGFASTALSGRGQTECVNLLFPQWTLDSAWKLAIGCLGTIFFAILLQGMVRMRADIQKGRYRVLFFVSLTSFYRYPLSLLLFSFQITVGYLLMLVTMTYNSELFCSVCIGLILGHALFNQDSYKTRDSTDSAGTELGSQGQEIKDGGNAQHVVDAHKVSVLVDPTLSTIKEAEEPLLNGLSCCGEF